MDQLISDRLFAWFLTALPENLRIMEAGEQSGPAIFVFMNSYPNQKMIDMMSEFYASAYQVQMSVISNHRDWAEAAVTLIESYSCHGYRVGYIYPERHTNGHDMTREILKVLAKKYPDALAKRRSYS